MTFSFAAIALQAAALSLSLGSVSQVGATTAEAPEPSSFIVWCDCYTPATKERMRRRFVRVGGEIAYSYRQFSAFAVAARRPGDAARLERRLRGLSGVTSVQPNGVLQLNGTAMPQ